MEEAELLTIGRFAELSGLSVHTLRHYDDVGLLPPAEVDPATGYRRYQLSQLPTARLIQLLRGIDLPIEETRTVLLDPGANAPGVLQHHRDRVESQIERLGSNLADINRYLQEGLTMPVTDRTLPVQLKIAVDDLDVAITFYQKAFGLQYDITRRTADSAYSSFVFGTYGQPGFFLLHLMADPDDIDRPGPTTFGLMVADLDTVHARALTAGATEVTAPHEPEGMPRCSALKDPSGNWVWLYQA